jgi:hypothetical protein
MCRLYDFVVRDALKEELKPAVLETSGTGAPPYGVKTDSFIVDNLPDGCPRVESGRG